MFLFTLHKKTCDWKTKIMLKHRKFIRKKVIEMFSGGCGSTNVHFTELIEKMKVTSCRNSRDFVCNPLGLSLGVFISRSSFILCLQVI